MSLLAIYDVPAPAKLNLFLHVVGRRADGYHLLQSVFALIDWCDSLHFERRLDGKLLRHDLGATLPADDLCLRAAKALQMASGTSLGADVSILKQVPWGAGLGGGSSDAASTLLALNRLWGLNWPRSRLLALAVGLGADVPFFVGGQNAFVEGIGDRLTPLPANALAGQRYMVVKPEAGIATAAIFGSPLLARDTRPVIVMSFLAPAGQQVEQQVEQRAGPQASFRWGFGRNDLQPPAEAVCAEVAQVAAWLSGHFGNSRMTGSGSAVFARVERDFSGLDFVGSNGTGGRPAATNGAGPLATALSPGWVGRMCLGLDHHPLLGWAD